MQIDQRKRVESLEKATDRHAPVGSPLNFIKVSHDRYPSTQIHKSSKTRPES